MWAEAAGDLGPWCQQAILGRTHWDAEALRDVVRDYVVETLDSFGLVPVSRTPGLGVMVKPEVLHAASQVWA